VLDEFPDDPGALNDLGYLWTEQGKNLQWARQMIQKAVDSEPENAAYLDSLGWAYYQLGQYAEAVQWLEKAAAGDEPDGVILDHLGDAYWKVRPAGQGRRGLAEGRRSV
jgi:Flp pilus assembly protein TadD